MTALTSLPSPAPLTPEELRQLQTYATELRHGIVDVTAGAGGAHIGGALSMVEILVALYRRYLRVDPAKPDDPLRDRFILSKGHGGVGHAVALAESGFFDRSWLTDFNQFGSRFGIHLDAKKVPGVDVSTGSLGHGLPIANGLALGARHQGLSWRTYCVLGDGECNEGSVWEAAMAAAHFGLGNLTAFVDRNRLMTDGNTEDVMRLEPFADKWRAFGWRVHDIDGHDLQQIAGAIEAAHALSDQPTMIIANTIKGRGVDFMENDVRWHYGAIDSSLQQRAHDAIDRMGATP